MCDEFDGCDDDVSFMMACNFNFVKYFVAMRCFFLHNPGSWTLVHEIMCIKLTHYSIEIECAVCKTVF